LHLYTNVCSIYFYHGEHLRPSYYPQTLLITYYSAYYTAITGNTSETLGLITTPKHLR